METKSFASDKVGHGDETAAPKNITRTTTGALKKKDLKCVAKRDDSVSIDVYEVVGNFEEHFRAAGLTNQGEFPDNKGPDPDNKGRRSFVVGDEVFLSLTKKKDALNKATPQQFLDIACMIQAEKAKKNKLLPPSGKKPAPKTTYATVTTSKMIVTEAPRPSVESTNAVVGVERQSDIPEAEDYGYLNYHGNEETVTDSSPSPKRADDNNKETEKEKSEDGVSSTEDLPEEGAAGKKIDGLVEVSGSDTVTKDGSPAPEENAERDTENEGQEYEQGVPDRTPDEVPVEGPSEIPIQVNSRALEEIPEGRIIQSEEIALANDVEEVVVSSGFAWGNDDEPRTEYYDTTGNIDEDGDLIGELKINETGSLEFVNKYNPGSVAENGTSEFVKEHNQGSVAESGTSESVKKYNPGSVAESGTSESVKKYNPGSVAESGTSESVKKPKSCSYAENGTSVETRDGVLVEKTGVSDKGAIQDEEIGSVAGEIVMEEGNKRKRARKSEETKKSNPKKRKVEKSKKNDSNDFGDGKDKGKSHGDKSAKKDSPKSGSSICDRSTLEETIDRVASGHLSLPFLENLRGEIRSLSRADLEELIVQKLCEVITERSVVGHLRKRAEALEKNQERWKEKVLSLTKEMKEMDMVMKNYMSEVRRHHTEKSFQMIAPLRVTRSVGLQVSFTATPSQLANPMPKCCKDAHHGREKGGKNSNRNVHVSQPPNKKIAILPNTPPEQPLVIDPTTKFSTKSGLTITLQPASSSSETQLASKPIPIQQPKLSILPATDSLSTSLADLTDEEKRQMVDFRNTNTTPQTLTVGPPGQVKVVNHIQPVQSSVGALTFLISNGTSPPCCSSTTVTTSESQNRQLPIPGSSTQSTQRHILPAISTLIYKPNSLIQPGSQIMTSQALSSVAKSAKKHPAPLPQPPVNQVHKPNWKLLPPRPALKIGEGDTGIVLSWNMTLGPEYETIVSYQLFAYQENDSPSCPSKWKRVADFKALRLPMACTLTQFITGYRYHFAVRAVDIHSRVGPFSFPSSVALTP